MASQSLAPRVPRVVVTALKENEMSFELRDTDCSVANALRRVMIAEVVTLAIDVVTFEENTTVLKDEVIAHRLGMFPIKYSYRPGATRLRDDIARAMASDRDVQRRFRFNRDCDCDAHCGWCAATFSLDVSFDSRAASRPVQERETPLVVSSRDLVCGDSDVCSVDFANAFDSTRACERGIALVKLQKGQHLSLTAVATLGIAKEHAKWSSVCRVTFRPEPTVVWDDAAVSALAPQLRNAIVGVCPAGVLGYSGADRSRIVVKRSDAILDFVDDITALTRTLSPTGHSMIAASASDSAFLFQVEALGQMPVEDVVLCALNELKNKLGDLQGELHTIELGATQD